MCLIVIAQNVHPAFPLIIAANRDEFLERPTQPTHFWDDAPHVCAGKDLRGGGTWLGVTKHGRFAALTNYRDLNRPPVNGPSRGLIVRSALETDIDPNTTQHYDGFNLIYGQLDALRYHNNIDGTDRPLPNGVHGVSNHLLDTPWPKVISIKNSLNDLLKNEEMISPDLLFELLNDPLPATDDDLPNTGVPLEWERGLSPIFIEMDGYGTRCSTVILLDKEGHLNFQERTFLKGNALNTTFDISIEIKIESR